ncbi:bola-like protein [Hypoxylon trugodes]|uniref:bola-like protein n=1 Tax=Hypoxylon trugodes TaxID=326681 RepID=UPI00219C18C5|nr:bola-like protein [Hypoxylon trugodes]KAI1385557.1 bola-like protein [Hypoxylon trugodes]
MQSSGTNRINPTDTNMAEATITEASLKAALTERLKAIHVEVTDMSGGCGQSFTSLIVSPQFGGQSSLKRHRAVNAALRDEIAAIHAWSAKCQTPDEWERDKASKNDDGPPLDGTVRGQVQGVDA